MTSKKVGVYLLLNPIPPPPLWMETSQVCQSLCYLRVCLADVPSFLDTYTLIYAFLTQKSLTKAANALKKEVKDVVVLKDGVKHEGPSLEDIINQWKGGQKKDSISYVRYRRAILYVLNTPSSPESDSDCTSLLLFFPSCLTQTKASDSSSSDSDSESTNDDNSSRAKVEPQAKKKDHKKPDDPSDSSGTYYRNQLRCLSELLIRLFRR